jgi:Heavy metal binding domain
MSIRINAKSFFILMATGLFVGCTSTAPPPLPANNPADPQADGSSTALQSGLGRDLTTVAIQAELSRTEKAAKSAETMKHGDMPGMDMPGMEHKETKSGDQPNAPSAANVEQEKKRIADEMKKTSEQMEKTSEELEAKSRQTTPAFYYTCVMHPEIHQDGPGKCPKCGMTLVKKEGTPPK